LIFGLKKISFLNLIKKGLNKIPLGVDQANKIGTLLYQMNQNKEQQ
jgi:hypothetical protein